MKKNAFKSDIMEIYTLALEIHSYTRMVEDGNERGDIELTDGLIDVLEGTCKDLLNVAKSLKESWSKRENHRPD